MSGEMNEPSAREQREDEVIAAYLEVERGAPDLHMERTLAQRDHDNTNRPVPRQEHAGADGGFQGSLLGIGVGSHAVFVRALGNVLSRHLNDVAGFIGPGGLRRFRGFVQISR